MDYIERNATEDVKDFTEELSEDVENATIRLASGSKGFSIRELAAEDGIIFEPEIDEGRLIHEEMSRNYFGNDAEEIERLLAERRTNIVDEDDDDVPDFDQLRARMSPITDDNGVMKKVIHTGLQSFGSVPPGATITIHYSIHLESQDEPFDSSILRGKPERYKLGDGRLIEGLEIAIYTMKKSERAQFMIDHQYAFGKMGCPPRVPMEATLLCKVELIDFVEEGVAEALLALPAEERGRMKTFNDIEKAVRLEHSNGNNYVSKEEWQMALKHYERGIKLLHEVNLKNEEEEERQQRLLLKLNLNKAHCCLKVHRPKTACIASREALDIDGDNVKALFRFGKAKRMLDDLDPARNLLIKALKKKPQDREINAELRSLEEQMERRKKEEKILCQNMFKGVEVTRAKRQNPDTIKDEFCETIYEELLAFREQPETEMMLPARFSNLELRVMRNTANNMSMDVVVSNEGDGARKVTVVKKNKNK